MVTHHVAQQRRYHLYLLMFVALSRLHSLQITSCSSRFRKFKEACYRQPFQTGYSSTASAVSFPRSTYRRRSSVTGRASATHQTLSSNEHSAPDLLKFSVTRNSAGRNYKLHEIGNEGGDASCSDALDSSRNNPLKHVAYIVDGNGRWALQNNKTRIQGHNIGANVTVEIVKESFALGVDVVTLYLFSTENWKRSNEEVLNIMFLLEKYLRDFSVYLKENNIRVRVIGQRHRLSDSVQLLLKALETSQLFNNDDKCKNQRTLCLAVSYGGRDDIIEATKRIVDMVSLNQLKSEDVTESLFSQNTMTGQTVSTCCYFFFYLCVIRMSRLSTDATYISTELTMMSMHSTTSKQWLIIIITFLKQQMITNIMIFIVIIIIIIIIIIIFFNR